MSTGQRTNRRSTAAKLKTVETYSYETTERINGAGASARPWLTSRLNAGASISRKGAATACGCGWLRVVAIVVASHCAAGGGGGGGRANHIWMKRMLSVIIMRFIMLG